ncbi:HBS1-like protein isoform X2 [Trifolium pratense]|uniref:HBS1-like protein isoform X2 n=1 Tax=Trifolium pratense TaxID=57577 RepID=UPI001E6926F8|nr:HBS1-like protein isoform X2 [Trifolium pratense]XP_045825669.1 HBS1-like protein isoform X2 [Trifolium pratense]
MPRKVNYGFDYDNDDYDDYDDDYDYDVDTDNNNNNNNYGAGEGPDTKQETIKTGVWGCSICTYDNDESMTSCDICGVMRYPLVNNGTSNSNKTVGDINKTPGASKLARSLFQPLPQQIPKEVVLFPMRDVGFWTDGSNIYKFENVQGEFHEIHKDFNTQSHTSLNIDKVKNSKDSQLSSSSREKKELAVESNAESLDNLSSLMQKNKQDSAAKNKLSKNVEINLETIGETLNSLSSSLPKDKGDNANRINSSKNGTHGTQSNKEKSGSLSALPKVEESDKLSLSSNKDGKSESASSSFNHMVLDERSGNSDNTNAKGPHKQVPYQPEKWMLPQQSEDTLTQLNLAIVGHVDSGKSTLSGRLLHLLGRISKKEMHKNEKEAKLQGKGSFAYAWALDESSEERERGITMTVAVAYFDTKKYHVVVLDSPGHKDFIPNMISGATQADAAILVIDASLGAFEAGMDGGKGQTREHAQLIRSFGVDHVIVAVNKMDAVAFSKDRFDFIRHQLGIFLRSCGFKDSSLSWIPLSAMENQNLVASPSDARFKNWYTGPYLLDAIDSLQPPTREFAKPLLMPICDIIKSTAQGQVSACGKLEAGALRSGTKVLVMPSDVVGTVRTLERDSNVCSVARAGDNVSVTLHGVDGSHVFSGGVLCHPDFPVAIAKHLELKLLVLDGASPILVGAQLEFHIHHAKEPARVSKILSVLDPKTGKVTKKSPRCLTSKQSAVIEVILHEPVCVVEFSRCKALGRVSLRSLGRTIAVGLVTRIIEEQG